MAFIPTPNGVKVCMRYSKAGQQVCNVFHVDVGATPTLADLNTIGAAFKDWWVAKVKAYQSEDVTLEAIEVTDISALGAPGIEYNTGLPQSGTPGAPAMANNVTVASKLSSGRTGRSFRGRSYFVGLTPAYVTADAQHINPTMVTAFNAMWEDLLARLVAAGFELAILSLVDHGAPRAAGLLTAVQTVITNTTLDSQRRRLPERGA